MNKLTFIAEYLITHELMDEDQFRLVMTSEPTVEEVENIAKQKIQNSTDENDAAKKSAPVEKEDVPPVIPAAELLDANVSKYNIKRKKAEESERDKTDSAENDIPEKNDEQN
jgi:hypothetical protein